MSSSLPADIRDLLTLQLVPGLGPRRIAALLHHFGSSAAALRAGADRLRFVPGIGEQLALQIASVVKTVDIEAEIALIERHGVHVLALGSPGYPESLVNVYNPPHLLYIRGALTDADGRSVALVGSRRCTAYGLRTATRLAAGLARAGVTVVSGLARGVDGAAHKAALDAGGRTLAVLAGGLSRIYPPEHADLARAVEGAGALLTESNMTQSPEAGLFPARNRIISGLCRAVVIVEAAEKSGALITAEHAVEQGRSVLAVPGPIDADASAGCHALIRTGAALCRSVDDILEEIDGVSAVSTPASASASVDPPKAAGPPPALDEPQRRIWEFLGEGIRSLDEMAQQLNVPVQQLSMTLMMLEMKKVVRRLPGSRYERC
jgi:DNA processing protein